MIDDLPAKYFSSFPKVTGPRPAPVVKQRGGTDEEWTAVARDVLAGDWRDVTGSEKASLIIGLRSIQTPECQAALAKLKP